MNARLIELAERRATLVAQAATQRSDLARAAGPLRTLSSTIDRGKVVAGYLRHHPVLLASGIAAVLLLNPRFFWKWLKRGWLAWHFALAVKRRLSGL